MFERSVILATIAVLAGCGSSSSPVAPTPPAVAPAPGSPSPSAGPPTITISATGFAPQEIAVAVGARVTFVNGDRIGHEISSGVDHNTRDCPEIDVVGFLVVGQSRETSPFAQTKNCRFHDHANLGNAAYQGRIVVQ